jgi:hypothetical protein
MDQHSGFMRRLAIRQNHFSGSNQLDNFRLLCIRHLDQNLMRLYQFQVMHQQIECPLAGLKY